MICCTHPGKMGDAIYALPTIRALCKQHNCLADFVTSEYCRPLENLFRSQPFIDKFIVSTDYKIQGYGLGVQPWHMPVQAGYDAVYQLGFRTNPDKPIPQFIAESAGITEPVQVGYHDCAHTKLVQGSYYVLAPRGGTGYAPLFMEFIRRSPIQIVQVGGRGDFVGPYSASLNFTGMDMLGVISLLAFSSGFVGMMSSQLCLANGFPIRKVVPVDGQSWDMRHAIHSPLNAYPVNPSAEQILDLLR